MIRITRGRGRFQWVVPRSPLLPTRWGLPFGVALAGGLAAGFPAVALLVMIVVVDVAAMVTTVPAVLA
ncbi:hypothetical protein ACFQ1S_04545, partial [Kibdelosporangium lantanae]